MKYSAGTGKVYNHSSLLVEAAKITRCPRCSGFGGVYGDDGECWVCNGWGRCWVSVSGWTRAKWARLESSKLY